MGITIDMFCKLYKANSKAKDKTFEDFINKHITTQYVPFLTKSVICDGIIQACCFIHEGDRDIVKIDSASRYLFFVMKLIQWYTDIELSDYEKSDDNLATDYDKLNEIGAVNVLISAIPENEYTEFTTLLNMKLDDLRDNQYSTTALFYNLKNSLSLSEEVINLALEEIQKQANKE